MNDLRYENAFEAIFGRGSGRAADFKKLADIALKYRDEVQLFFGTEEELKYLKELKLKQMERDGVTVVRD